MLKKIIKYFKFAKKNDKNVEEAEANKKQLQSNAPLPPPSQVFIPDELIVEILSFLNVKTITRFKCVRKSWNTLVSDPTFVQKHLKKSSQNPHLIMVVPPHWKYPISAVKFFSVSRLLENPSITMDTGDYNSRSSKGVLVNSCNGLLCMLFSSYNWTSNISNYRFCLWNPATTTFAEIGTFDFISRPPLWNPATTTFVRAMFTFGCDIITGTYKVVAVTLAERNNDRRYQVRIHSLGDNCWRNINSFPLTPLISHYNNGLYFSGTVSWLAIREYNFRSYYNRYINNVEQFVIVTLNLSTETYTQFLLPSGFDHVPRYHPTLEVLMDRFCFSHDFKGTQFIIWQMKEFGVRESWTQLFRIDYFNLQICTLEILSDLPVLLPVYLSRNQDILILVNCVSDHPIIYNHRENRVERITNFNSNIVCPFYYIESLVSTPLKSATPTENTLAVPGSMIGKSILNWCG